MKKITLLIVMAFTVSLIIAQSPCCKNKAKGVSCKNSAKVVDVNKTVEGGEVLPACCKAKADKGLSCCKNKQLSDAPSCSTKKWWQVWKKSCNKPCCDKS